MARPVKPAKRIKGVNQLLEDLKGKMPYEVSPSQTHELYRIAKAYVKILEEQENKLQGEKKNAH